MSKQNVSKVSKQMPTKNVKNKTNKNDKKVAKNKDIKKPKSSNKIKVNDIVKQAEKKVKNKFNDKGKVKDKKNAQSKESAIKSVVSKATTLSNSKSNPKSLKKVSAKAVAKSNSVKADSKSNKSVTSSVKANIKTQKTVAKSNKKKSIKGLVITILIFVLLLGGGVYYLVWNANRTFDITFIDVEGVTYEGYDNLTVKNGTEFSFTIDLDDGIAAYSKLAVVKANGLAITAVAGTYTVRIAENTTIVAQGYGTSGMIIEGGVVTTGVNTSSVVIPYGVTEIGRIAFANYSAVESVCIPETVAVLSYACFGNCTSLATINITDYTYDISVYVFSDTLWYNNQPNGAVYVGKVLYSYKGNGMPENYTLNILDGTTGIAAYACGEKNNLIAVNIPSSVRCIGEFGFVACVSLTTITMGNNVEKIYPNAFLSTGWFNQQPEGLVYLENWVYGYKGTLNTNTLTIRDDTVGIAGKAFYNMGVGLTGVDIPDSVSYIGDLAFYQTGLTSIDLPNSLTSIGESAFANVPLTSLTLSDTIKNIGNQAFAACTNLTSITINSDINFLREQVFRDCTSLASVVITSNNLSNIKADAFIDCSSLNSLTISTATPPIISGINFLSDASSSLQIYVLESSLSTYKSASSWSAFGDKIFAISR